MLRTISSGHGKRPKEDLHADIEWQYTHTHTLIHEIYFSFLDYESGGRSEYFIMFLMLCHS